MADTLELQKGLAFKLIELNAEGLAETKPGTVLSAALHDPEFVASAALNAIRRVIGASLSTFPPGPERVALKQTLAPALGNPLGQLLAGMDDRHIAACLEGHAHILATTMGATPIVNITVSSEPAPPAHPSHLKVVQ